MNLSYDYEIVFHDSQKSYLKWVWCLGKCLPFTFAFHSRFGFELLL